MSCAAQTQSTPPPNWTPKQPTGQTTSQLAREQQPVAQAQPQQATPPRVQTQQASPQQAAPPPQAVQAPKPKVAVYVTGGKNANENKALAARITHGLVNSGRYSAIERADAFLDQVAREMVAQRSGAIDDKQISELGRQAGANFVCVGEILEVFGDHQISARIINVVSVEVIASGVAEGALRNINDFAVLSNSVVASMLGVTPSAVTSAVALKYYWNGNAVPTSQTSQPTQTATQANTPTVATSTIKGTAVPGNSLADKLAWLQRSAESHNTYILQLSANENIAPHIFEYRGAINITIVLKGDNTNRIIRLRSHGNMFTIRPNVTLILDNNITLQGHSGNTLALVNVSGGEFIMNTGSSITDNANVSSAETPGGGGGVRVTSGTFTMNAGLISRNAARAGGGVSIGGGNFTMIDGTISGNTAIYAGGVDVHRGTFTMNGGTISDNKTTVLGGGVGMNNISTTQFIMRGGIITGNTTNGHGGGVCAGNFTNFTKSGGIITGYSSDSKNGNVVRDGDGTLARRGHAVYIDENRRRESTAGPAVNISTGNPGGGWEN